MATAKLITNITVSLELTQAEAEYLQNMTQNFLGLNRTEDTTEQETRHSIFSTLKQVLVTPGEAAGGSA